MRYEFVIEGEPKPKQRPKARIVYKLVKGKKIPLIQMYTPKETVEYESYVAETYRQSGLPNFGDDLLKMEVQFVYEPPKSWSKKKKQAALDAIGKNTKPDVDNLIKALCDGLNGVAYDDDSNIVQVTAEKIYGEKGMTIVWLECARTVEKNA